MAEDRFPDVVKCDLIITHRRSTLQSYTGGISLVACSDRNKLRVRIGK